MSERFKEFFNLEVLNEELNNLRDKDWDEAWNYLIDLRYQIWEAASRDQQEMAIATIRKSFADWNNSLKSESQNEQSNNL